MITDAFIKQEFIHRILARDAAVIADTQVDRLRRHQSQRARQMALQLASHPFQITSTGLHATLTFNIMTSLRFMDISISKDIKSGEKYVYHFGTLIYFSYFCRNFQNYGSSKQQRIQSEPEKVF